jgi:SAM-dependent methyltransferase
MGLGHHGVEALVREHKHRPISGNVVLIGRQAVYFSPHDILELLRAHSIDVEHVAAAEIEIDRRTVNRAQAATGRDLVTDQALFRLLGVPRVLALDHSDYEGAEIIHDLNKPIPQSLLDFADFIVDGSTLDNVFDPAMVIRNFARMLKPGGRLITINMYSNHYEPYAILPPLWYLDFFVINEFADCKVYILVMPGDEVMAAAGIDVFVINTDYLLDPSRFVSAFASPHMMATIVIAEKGSRSTSHKVPSQQHYRSEAEWASYRQNLLAMSRDSHPHAVRSLGDISFFDVKSGHLFMATDFTARDPLTEIRRVQKRESSVS